ncbi:Similar to Athila ORF1 [Arabidopsis thaliana]|uniref:F28L22.4 protein n=1 Tax=Arabidopsis thaliana TaxID=3702 RepID=Q9SHR4_ARATH|nr:Similar to Athila ORF1 [Arabidopsis thaliana]
MAFDMKIAELHNKIGCSYNDLNVKFEALNSKIKYVESQFASTSALEHPQQLPGKAVQNPKDYATGNAITIHQEDESPPSRQTPHTEENMIQEGGGDSTQIAAPATQQFIWTIKHTPLLNTHHPGKKFKIEKLKKDQNQEMISSASTQETYKKKIIQEKLDDPGSFTLPCSLGPLTFNRCLCDLGASVSLMPLSTAKRLGIMEYKFCNLALLLADGSVAHPHGLIENLPVKIENVEIPTDFVVLDVDEKGKDPLILGRPFLASAGAVIDVRNGKINLNLEGIKMKFDIRESSWKSTTGVQNFGVQNMDVDEETEAGTPPRVNYTSQVSKLKRTFDHMKRTTERLAQTEDPTEDDWYEMRKINKWQSRVIEGLSSRVMKLKDQLWMFEKRVKNFSNGIDLEKMETALAIKEDENFTTEWFAPEDQKVVHLEERSLESKLLSEEETPILIYSPGVPKQPTNTSAEEEYLIHDSVAEELLKL